MITIIIICTLFFSFIKSQEGGKPGEGEQPEMGFETIFQQIYEPSLYKNEICSYNGYPEIEGFDDIKCHCYSSFVDEPNKKNYKYIRGQKVHCSYQKKKRFKTLFLAGILPMGLDYYYLGHIFYFVIILLLFVGVIVSNCVEFYMSYQLDEKAEESKYKYNEMNENILRTNTIWNKANNKIDDKDKNKRCLKIYNIINRVCLCLFFIYWMIDIVLQAKGLIKDSNGIETDNDISVLFSRVEIE